jgi:hypothetical protein
MMSFVRAGVGIAIVPSGVIAGLLGKRPDGFKPDEDLQSFLKRCGATVKN